MRLHNILAASLLATALQAQFPPPIPINDTSPASPERFVLGAKISPCGQWVAYSWEVSGNPLQQTLGVRRADGSSTSTFVVSQFASNLFLHEFTWRWDRLLNRCKLLFTNRRFAGTDVIEFDPSLSSFQTLFTNTNATDARLQEHPCGDVLFGTWQNTFVQPTVYTAWQANLAGGPTTPTALFTTPLNLRPLDVDPSGGFGTYILPVSPPNTQMWRIRFADGFRQQVSVTGPQREGNEGGFLDVWSSVYFGYTLSNFVNRFFLLARDDFGSLGQITNNLYTDTPEVAAQPAHLQSAAANKRWLVFNGPDLIGPFTGRPVMHPG